MSDALNFAEIKKKAYTTYHEDGILDLLIDGRVRLEESNRRSRLLHLVHSFAP